MFEMTGALLVVGGGAGGGVGAGAGAGAVEVGGVGAATEPLLSWVHPAITKLSEPIRASVRLANNRPIAIRNCKLSAKRPRQILFRVSKDLDNCLTRRRRQRRLIARVLFLSREYFPHAPVDRILHTRRQRVERGRVDQVAARVFHQTPIQIELVERAA